MQKKKMVEWSGILMLSEDYSGNTGYGTKADSSQRLFNSKENCA